MQVKVTAKLAAMSHFQSKPEKGSKDYYIFDCLILDGQKSERFQGYRKISVFVDEPHYNAFLNSFKPLMDIELFGEISGTSVLYHL